MNENQTKIPVVNILYAGGTISSLMHPDGYREGGHMLDLLEMLVEKYPDVKEQQIIGLTQIAYTGMSENITENDLQDILTTINQSMLNDPDGIVITHGTDAMEQTARAIQKEYANVLLKNKCVIILTGSNDITTDNNTDAWDNFNFAISSAGAGMKPGVYIAFHDQIVPANEIVKEPFNGMDMEYASEVSPEYLAKIEKLNIKRKELIDKLTEYYSPILQRSDIIDYPVNVIRANHSKLIEDIALVKPTAVLMTTYHTTCVNGNSSHAAIPDLVEKLNELGILVFGVTENGESIDFTQYDSTVKLGKAGMISLESMDHDVALAKLQMLDTKLTKKEIIAEMITDRCGELAGITI